jgi:hypothetical protein
MMLHVFVETNWVVDYVDPSHVGGAPRLLLAHARAGDVALHLPSCCVVEARRAIKNKASARRQMTLALRDFLTVRRDRGETSATDVATVQREIDLFDGEWSDPTHVESELRALYDPTSGIDVFPLNDRMLARLAALGAAGDIYLEPFDQAILAAVLGRAEELAGGGAELRFCELDGHLRPWTKDGQAKQPLTRLYDEARVWVHPNFDWPLPSPPAGWPP